jgi:hypothetical protein
MIDHLRLQIGGAAYESDPDGSGVEALSGR